MSEESQNSVNSNPIVKFLKFVWSFIRGYFMMVGVFVTFMTVMFIMALTQMDSSIEIPYRSVLGLYLSVQKDPFLKINPTTWTTSPGADGMVTILNAETG